MDLMRLTTEQKARVRKLVDTLRTTKKRQGHAYLVRRGSKMVKYCCLGIACEVALAEGVELQVEHGVAFGMESVNQYNGAIYTLPGPVRDWFGFASFDPVLIDENGKEDSATGLNDEQGYNFKRIADAFERTYLNSPESK